MFLTVWLVWVLFPMLHRALISLCSADLICCFQFGIVYALQCSSSFKCEHVISCNRFNARSRNQVQICLFALIWHLENDQIRLKKASLVFANSSYLTKLFCDLEKSNESWGATFYKGLFAFLALCWTQCNCFVFVLVLLFLIRGCMWFCSCQ